jgi:hypothetical protein
VVRLEQRAAHPAFIFGFLARDNARQSIIRAERLAAELIENIDRLFAPLPLDERNKARSSGRPAQACIGGLAQAARDSNGDETAWRSEALPHADVRQWRRRTRQSTTRTYVIPASCCSIGLAATC